MARFMWSLGSDPEPQKAAWCQHAIEDDEDRVPGWVLQAFYDVDPASNTATRVTVEFTTELGSRIETWQRIPEETQERKVGD